MMIYFLV